jgi:dienelactone hydrolase
MATVALFHSVYGLRPAVLAAADRLRAAGHTVMTPDLYRGEVAGDVEAGREIRNRIGIEVLLERAAEAVSGAPRGMVYAGFSMGAAISEHLVVNDTSAHGLIFIHGYGNAGNAVQPGCPAQAHNSVADPFFDAGELQAWLTAYGDRAQSFEYAGGGHLYTDSDLPDYDHEAAELTWSRVLAFLAEAQ